MKFSKRGTFAVAAAITVAATTTAIAAGEPADNQDQQRYPAAAQMQVFAHPASDGQTVSDADRQAIVESLPEAREGDSPARSDVAPATDGRVLLDAFGTRVTAIPTSTGQVCFLGRRFDQPQFSGCAGEFTDGGLVPAYTHDSEGGPVVNALVASDVDSITITTADGKRHAVSVADGAFWWVGASTDNVVALTTERDGRQYEERELFVDHGVPSTPSE